MERLVVLAAVVVQSAVALWLGECNLPLGVSTGELDDAALSASSSHDHIVGPHRARLGMDGAGGAWCPRASVDMQQSEWLEVDLGRPRLVTAVATQGRYAGGQGMEYTPAYTLSYWRPGMDSYGFYAAHPELANKTLLVGNRDTYTEVKNLLERPLLASRVRLRPFSAHPRTVCLRLELYGCNYTAGLRSYSVGAHHDIGAGVGELVGVGEGVLYDGRAGGGLADLHGLELEEEDEEEVKDEPPSSSGGGGLESNHDYHSHTHPHPPPTRLHGLEPAPDVPVVITFNFDDVRRFAAMFVYLTVTQHEDQPSITATTKFGSNSSHFDDVTVTSTWHESDLNLSGAQNLTFDLRKRPGKVLQVSLEVRAVEVIIQEVYFESSVCGCKVGDWEKRPPTTPEEHTASRPLPHPPASPPADVWAVYTARQHRTYVGVAVGFSVGVGVLVLVWAGVWLRRRRGKTSSPRVFRRPPPDTLDMKSLMEGVGVMGTGVGMGVGGGTCTPTYEEGSCLLYEDLQKTPLVSPSSTLPRPASPSSTLPHSSTSDHFTPVYATPTLRPSSSFPTPTPALAPIPRPLTLASLSRPPPIPSIPPPPDHQEPRIQVPMVTGPWLTSVYRQDGPPLVPPLAPPSLPAHLVSRTQVLASGAFATLSVGVVSSDSSTPLGEGGDLAPPPRPAALITVTAPEVVPSATRHAQLLGSLTHRNLARLMGVVVGGPVGVTMVTEYQPDAHLPEYLHARALAPARSATYGKDGETTYATTGQTIGVGDLVGVARQVAAAMEYLESRRVTHTDLAARNVVMVGGVAKVTQVAVALPRYATDYWRAPDGRGPAPLRWLSPEALCQNRFTPLSDVWAFGVTMWEVLTLCRRRPHHHLSDDLLFHALATTHHHTAAATLRPLRQQRSEYAQPQVVLMAPAWCPRDLQDLMTACWCPQPARRPTFATVHAALVNYADTITNYAELIANRSHTLANHAPNPSGCRKEGMAG